MEKQLLHSAVHIHAGVDINTAAASLLSVSPKTPSCNFDTSEMHMLSQVEQRHYLSGTETRVPAVVTFGLQWLQDNNAEFLFFRKELSNGCHQAIEARRAALGDETIRYEDELKTMVFKGFDKKSGKKLRVALHMQGTSEVYSFEGRNTMSEIKDYLNHIILPDSKEYQYDFGHIEIAKTAMKGRQDPLAVMHKFPDAIHVFQKDLTEDPEREMYCNIGRNTWSVKLKIAEFIDKFAKVANIHIGDGFMRNAPYGQVIIDDVKEAKGTREIGDEEGHYPGGIARIG